MHPNEKRAREEAANADRFALNITVREARVLLDWGLSEEAMSGWMDWHDEQLRERLTRLIEQGSEQTMTAAEREHFREEFYRLNKESSEQRSREHSNRWSRVGDLDRFWESLRSHVGIEPAWIEEWRALTLSIIMGEPRP